MGQYIYAVIDANGKQSYGPIGLDGTEVHAIVRGPIAAVVSEMPEKRIRPERKNLATHNAVVKLLTQREPAVLPVAFGTLSHDRKAVLEILTRNLDVLLPFLEKVRGKVEMGLHVTLDVPNVFEYMVNSQAELAALRDRVYGKQHGPSQMDQIELGSLFDRLLNSERERCTNMVIQVLEAHCADIHQNPPRENEVMRLACLVDRSKLGEFENAVFEAANLFDNNFALDFNGPWAPHNFVDVNLDAEDAYA